MANVDCRILNVEHDVDTGWFKILTDQGDYSTKIREKADEAVSLKGERVSLDYDEQVKSKDGRTYRNKYYNRAAVLPSEDGGGSFTETSSRRTPREDAWRMCLNKGGELAVGTLPLMPNEQRTFDVQKQIAIAWAKFFFFTPVPDMAADPPPPNPEQAHRTPIAAAQDAWERKRTHPGAYDEPPNEYTADPDRDIPYLWHDRDPNDDRWLS